MKDDQFNLAYIAECIDRVQRYTEEGQAAFMQSSLIQDAVVRNLSVIGEATKNLSDSLRSTYPEVPWRKIAGLRDVLIHNYITVNLELIWSIVEQDLPDLDQKIMVIQQNLEQQ